jgi:hypothetical protein
MDELPSCMAMQTAAGPVVVATEVGYDVEKGEADSTTTTYTTRSTVLFTFDGEGRQLWERPLNGSGAQKVAAIPSRGETELLLIVDWNRFSLVDHTGEELLAQPISYGDRLLVTDVDGDGVPEFLIIGSQVTCYRLLAGAPDT